MKHYTEEKLQEIEDKLSKAIYVVMENKKEILVFEKNKPREYKRKSLLYDLSFGIRGVKL